jgi:UDPglucose 6-dehydrogenase
VLALHNPSISVTVLDRDASRIARWNSAHLPIHEPGLSPVVRLARDGGVPRHVPSPDLPRIDSLVMTPCSRVDRLREAPRKPNLFFSTDSAASIRDADLILLSVNTPTKASGKGAGSASDLSAIEGATRDIAAYAKPGAIIVEKSTVPCGTANLIGEIVSTALEIFPIYTINKHSQKRGWRLLTTLIAFISSSRDRFPCPLESRIPF